MKAAVYVEGGFTQVVLTPESEFERKVLDFAEDRYVRKFYRGVFHRSPYDGFVAVGGIQRAESLILTLEDPPASLSPSGAEP